HVHINRMFRRRPLGLFITALALAAALATALPMRAASAMALILVDADSGKVLRSENATYPWYPASTTKLMTLYMTLSAIREQRITPDTLFTVSANANGQGPTKMGIPVGAQVTVDNAIKMMMVKSANDMAVVLAEGVGGSMEAFAQQMTETAHRLGMTESNFVNPNGLPDDGQIVSARDLAILARALIREFPQYSSYWHVPAIKYGRRVVRNYNPLLGRYAGADGMKTGFICSSGFNLVATATRDNRQLIAVVLGAPTSAARAQKAAELLESGFMRNPLAWLLPAFGNVNALTPIEAAPPDLKDDMCGPHRKRHALEAAMADSADPDAGDGSDSAGADANSQKPSLVTALRAPAPKNLLSEPGAVTPVVVYTGPTRTAEQIAALAALPEYEPSKKKGKHKGAAKTAEAKQIEGKAEAKKESKKDGVKAKPAQHKSSSGKTTDRTTTAQ
ncbi:MAG TPA: D-alanyl-D-alanine carboxypeptidase family protein, partial [Xanthobacteraceae bacterium]|nr:D-alanyl-D-alanine carboxypeptidase family protein [Xanthobacteraceae bacterium]